MPEITKRLPSEYSLLDAAPASCPLRVSELRQRLDYALANSRVTFRQQYAHRDQ